MIDYKQKSHLTDPVTKSQMLQLFSKHGCQPFAMITKQKMFSIFQSQYQQRKRKSLNIDLLQEIWDQSEATSKGEISVNTITDIISEAQIILAKRINQLSGPDGLICKLEEKVGEKKLQVKQFAQFHGEDRDYLNSVTKEYINLQIQAKQNKSDLIAFHSDYQAINVIFCSQRPRDFTQYTIPVPPKFSLTQQKSPQLLTAFHLTNALLLFEFFLMSSIRVSLLPISALLHSYQVILLGFSEPKELMYVIIHLIVSILGDITFVVLTMLNKYQIMPYKFNGNSTYVLVLGIFLVASIALRLFMLTLLIAVRSKYQPNIVQYFTVFGSTFPPYKAPQILPTYGYYSQYSYNEKQKNYQTKMPGEKETQRDIKIEQRDRINEFSHVQNFEAKESFGSMGKDQQFSSIQHYY